MKKQNVVQFVILGTFGGALVGSGFAGQPQKWADVPEPVRNTVLANGGAAGQAVDRESIRINSQAVYEAGVKDAQGNVLDLVMTADGKLVETKRDDATDRAEEQAAHSSPQFPDLKFSHPTEITNPHLPLASLKQDILEGTEDGKRVRVERTALPQQHKTFKIGNQAVESLVVEDRAFEDGVLAEVARDYFAQDDEGTVYYLGEDVDEYENGKIVGHSGAWLLGVQTQIPGVLFPAHPKVGDKFQSENVPNITTEDDEVISVSETVTVPAGTYRNCVKIKEQLSDGKTEFKYYAPGVGVVREVPAKGNLRLKSHQTISAKVISR